MVAALALGERENDTGTREYGTREYGAVREYDGACEYAGVREYDGACEYTGTCEYDCSESPTECCQDCPLCLGRRESTLNVDHRLRSLPPYIQQTRNVLSAEKLRWPRNGPSADKQQRKQRIQQQKLPQHPCRPRYCL